MKNNVIINWNKKFSLDKCPFDEFVGKKFNECRYNDDY